VYDGRVADLTAFAKTHWFVLLAAVLIGATIRLLKSDTVFPVTVKNKRLYAPIALLLGLVVGVLDHLYYGTPWRIALVRGLFAGFLPVVGHDVVVKGALGAVLSRAGLKDVPVGKLLSIDSDRPTPPTTPASPATPGTAPTLPAPAPEEAPPGEPPAEGLVADAGPETKKEDAS